VSLRAATGTFGKKLQIAYRPSAVELELITA
jgi:hypothetical protein